MDPGGGPWYTVAAAQRAAFTSPGMEAGRLWFHDTTARQDGSRPGARREILMSVVTMRELLEAGVHFGHQTRRWNPKMKPFIFQERNGTYIIDLALTVQKLRETYEVVKQMAREGKVILFVGTKKQAQDVVRDEAERAGTFFVNQRWLGGTLTNFSTIQKRIARLRELENMKAQGDFDRLPKKEVAKLQTRWTSSSASSAASKTCIASPTRSSSSIRKKSASRCSKRAS